MSLCDFFSGWLAGVCGLIFGHPLDTLKVRRQTENYRVAYIMKCIYRDEGVRGYYKGFFVPLLTTGFTNSVFFGIFSNTLTLLSGQKEKICCDPDEIPKWHMKLACASCAGSFFYIVVNCPVEVVKTRLQVDKRKNPMSMRETVALIYSKLGIKGLYMGWSALCIRDIPYLTAYPLVYDRMICYMRKQMNKTDLDLKFQLLAGGLTGIVTWLPFIPADVIKARIQSDNISRPNYQGFFDCFQKCYRREGISVFYNGFAIGLFRVFIANAIILPVFNNTIKFCNERSIRKKEK